VISGLNGARVFPYAASFTTVLLAVLGAGRLPELSAAQIALLIVTSLTLPLFPLHGVYIAALSRTPGYSPVVLALLLPTIGLYGLSLLSGGLPSEALRALGVLALSGALYGSFKALAQVRMADLLAHASMAFYSALWWHFAVTGKMPLPSAVYTAALALLTAGVLLAALRLRRRYGELTLERMHGLARPMPRFAAVFTLLVMGFGHVEMLPQPALALSPGLAVIVLTWFLASWYVFRMMQRLLFGPHREDLRYEDLRAHELGYFVALLAVLAILGGAPFAVLESGLMLDIGRAHLETMLWHR
jgi:NADH-quinone oxidoreductase subunit M